MIAYNRQYLDNREVQEQAAEAVAKNVITAGEQTRIVEAYPYNLYTPNIYVRIGLFLLTVLVSACCLGLYMLMFGAGFSVSIALFGLISYVVLELFIHNGGTYRSGVDDALLWVGGGLVLCGINFAVDHISPAAQSLIICLLAVGGVVRYADRLMALVAYGALLSMIFHLVAGMGGFARALLPFLLMGVSVILYFLFTRLLAEDRLRHYHSCGVFLRVAALLSFYLAGNYYMVRELNGLLSGGSGTVALGWLWWVLTAITPIIYIVKGIQKKDDVLLWTGMALVAAAIFTVRYYYHLLPAELAMIIGGSVLIAGAYGLIRYLRVPRRGFTSDYPEDPHPLGNLPVEGLILAESFHAAGTAPEGPGFQFGGGSGGGGGAGGGY